MRRETSGVFADGEAVWFWRPDAGVKLAEEIPKRRSQQSPVSGENTEETVKTIARGMPGQSGEPVVDLLVVLFYFAREAAGATGTRHSLRPLFGGTPISKPRARRAAGRFVMPGLDPGIHRSS